MFHHVHAYRSVWPAVVLVAVYLPIVVWCIYKELRK